jgi:hypothetical protein
VSLPRRVATYEGFATMVTSRNAEWY